MGYEKSVGRHPSASSVMKAAVNVKLTSSSMLTRSESVDTLASPEPIVEEQPTRIPFAEAFGFGDGGLSHGALANILGMEMSINGGVDKPQSNGLVYTIYHLALQDLGRRGVPTPAAFTYDAVCERYQTNH